MRRVIALVVMLSGCSSLESAPERVEVPVPVRQPCILESDIPARPDSAMTPGVNVERLASGASADLRASDVYTQQLLALLRACAEEPAK